MAADPNLTTSPGTLHPEEQEFNFRRALTRHWRESMRHYGLWHTVTQEVQAFYRLMLELLPGRRRAKFGDLDYDWDHMVDTTRTNVPFRMQLAAALAGHQYFPSEPWLFEQIMEALPIDSSEYTFIDLGSGKGRTLLMAATWGFRRVVGVEYIPELHRIAQENIRKVISARQLATEMQILCLDARDFDFSAEPLVLYMFNPFPAPALAGVLKKLRRSVEEHPRPVFVAYRYLEFERLLASSGWLEKVAGTEQWAVYRSTQYL